MKKKIKITEKKFVALMIRFQDECCLHANCIATAAIKHYGLQKEHQKQTKNPDSAYETR